MQPVSLTAQWTAAIRAREHERAQGSLFHDELAKHLAMPDGFELLERYSGGGVQDFVAIRTRFFDDACNANCESASPIKQVVMVAAGMDTRVYRLAWPEGAHVFELDHAALLEEKAQRLQKNGAKPGVAVTAVPVDFADNWIERLLSAGFDRSNPTFWLAEGLLFFLTPAQVEGLLKTLLSASAPGSRLVADMTSETLLHSPFSRSFLQKLERDGVPWRFGTDSPERFLKAAGWCCICVKQPGEPGAGEGRWPYKVASRDVPGVARNWLIQAAPRCGKCEDPQ
ncbi:SAM-dependent methyltransferase [uncultured Bradyrhizobium sp.]|uniref:SAM-dependent methyltransferase n=1 Tax=uncultured Bradyrhizobium sp. TaxID=199684 RepID=UPI0035CBB6EC